MVGCYIRFVIDNPEVWSQTWEGEYSWSVSDGKLYEYACHEGNYASVGNILRGARPGRKRASTPNNLQLALFARWKGD